MTATTTKTTATSTGAATTSEVPRAAAAGAPADTARQPPAPRGKRLRPYAILGAVAVLAGVGYLAFHALTAGRESTDDAQIATDMVPVAARVPGLLISVPVTDNQPVKKGDLLAQIDPEGYQNKVTRAEAELRAAQARALAAQAQTSIATASSKGGLSTARAVLSGTTASVAGADADVAAAQAMLAKARADADKADSDLRRAQALRKDDAVPQAQVDQAEAQAAAAHAGVAQAQAQVTAARERRTSARTRIGEAAGRLEQSTPVEAQLTVARANAELAAAQVAAAEVALAEARLDLGYTRVVAPRDGHISKLAVHAGQLVQSGQTLTYVLPNVTYVIANFKETQVGDMRPGQPATVTVDAFPGRTFRARVESISFGTGAQFSMLPPDNASGNFVKVVQRVPVKLTWSDSTDSTNAAAGQPLAAGLSANVVVRTR